MAQADSPRTVSPERVTRDQAAQAVLGLAAHSLAAHSSVAHDRVDQQGHVRATLHLNGLAARLDLLLVANVQALRLDQRPVANADPAATIADPAATNADPAAEDRPITSLADSSICRGIVTSVSEMRSLIVDRNGPAPWNREGPLKTTESPNDTTAFRIAGRNRSRTEQPDSTIGVTKSVAKPVTIATNSLTNGENSTRVPTTGGGMPNGTRQATGGGEVLGLA